MPITCSSCHGLTSEVSPKCHHCGARVRVEPKRALSRAVVCAGCRAPSEIVRLGPIEIDVCSSCAGIWFDRGELEQLRREALRDDFDWREALETLAPARRVVELKQYLNCPVCDGSMIRKNHLDYSGVFVHRCPDHGTFVTRAVLEKILGFVAEGREDEWRAHADRVSAEKAEQRLRDLEARIGKQDIEIARTRQMAITLWLID